MPTPTSTSYSPLALVSGGVLFAVILLAGVGAATPPPPTAGGTGPTAAEPRTPCNACHEDGTATHVGDDPKNYLNANASLSKQAWGKNINLQFRCGGCHLVPQPEWLPIYPMPFLPQLSIAGNAFTTIAGRNMGQASGFNAGIFYVIDLSKKEKTGSDNSQK